MGRTSERTLPGTRMLARRTPHLGGFSPLFVIRRQFFGHLLKTNCVRGKAGGWASVDVNRIRGLGPILGLRCAYFGYKNDGKARVEINCFQRGYNRTWCLG